MAEKNGSHVWRSVSSHLVTIIMTGFSAWLSFGGGIDRSEAEKIAAHAADDAVESFPTREDVSLIIETESPYAKDKSAIEVRLKHIEETVMRIDRKLNQ